MSMTGEMVTTYDDAAFAELVEGFDKTPLLVEDVTVVADGLTSVMARARATALEINQRAAAGITDVNGEAAAFQSAR